MPFQIAESEIASRANDLSQLGPVRAAKHDSTMSLHWGFDYEGLMTPLFRMRTWPSIGRYGFAAVALVIALMLRMQLDRVLPPGFPYLTFFPTVILTTFLAGTGPGVVCAALSGLAAWYFFIPPERTFAFNSATAIALALYLFIVSIDIVLIHVMRAATDRLNAQRKRTDQLLAEQRTMFQELQHRVANNMAFVGSLLHLQRRNVVRNPATAVAAIDEATARLHVMSRIHRRLYDPASAELPVADYFREVCGDLLEAAGCPQIRCHVDMPDIRMDISRLMTLSLLITELVTNSLKHAFGAGDAGQITLKLEQPDHRLGILSVADDGCGLPSDYDPTRSVGLGSKIVQGLATQLNGELTIAGREGQGTCATLRFALS